MSNVQREGFPQWALDIGNWSLPSAKDEGMIYNQLKSFIDEDRPCALATLVAVHGSSPQNTCARVLFLPDGRIIGTIGGGCLEAEARRVGLDCLRTNQCKLFDLRLDDDF